MPKSLSFRQVIEITARQKHEAAHSRANPDPTAEKPKDAILAAIAIIADRMSGDGFTFLKSGPKLKRSPGDFTHEIYFQSDRNNIAGRRAAVWIHAGISSEKLAKWRRNHPSSWVRRSGPHAGSITGGQIGNLVADPSWMEWDFADSMRRAAEIEDAIAAIKRIILPFFAMFDDPASAIDILVHRPVVPITSVLEYALVALDRSAAEAAGRSFLKANPAIREGFELDLQRFTREGIPAYRGDVGSDLAALALAAGLDLSGAR